MLRFHVPLVKPDVRISRIWLFTLSIWVQALESERLRNFGEGQVSANALDPDSNSGEEGWPPGTADSH